MANIYQEITDIVGKNTTSKTSEIYGRKCL